MLRIVLLILKIIGITLLSLLGLLVVLALLVLFVPIRYKVRGKKEEETWLRARIKWLFGIISVKLDYKDEKLTYSVRVCGKLLVSDKPKKKRNKRKKTSLKQRTKALPHKPTEPEEIEPNKGLSKAVIDAPKDKEASTSNKEPYDPGFIEDEHEIPKSNSEYKERKSGWLDRIVKIPEHIKSLLHKVRERITNLILSIQKMLKKISMVKEFLKDKANKQGFSKCLFHLKNLYKHIKPRKLKARLRFGTGDPSSTGQLLGAVCAVYPQIIEKVQLAPDFEEKILQGELYARGRIRVITLLIIFLKVIRDRDITILRKNISKLKEEL